MMMNKILALIGAILMQPTIFSDAAAKAIKDQNIQNQHFWGDEFAGNTLVIPNRDQPSKQSATYFVPDGTGWTATKTSGKVGELRRIRWFHQSDGLFCAILLDSSDKNSVCSAISISGSRVLIISAGKPNTSGNILRSDAWKLEEQALGKAVPSLAGKAASDAIIGNTFIVTSLGGTNENGAYYFQADGTGQILAYDSSSFGERISSASTSQIQWAVSGSGKLCISWESKKHKDWECSAVFITGDRVTWKLDNGYSFYGRLASNDAKNLSRSAMAAAERTRASLIGNTLLFRRPDLQGEESAIYIAPEGAGSIATKVNEQNSPPRRIQWLLRDDMKLFCLTETGKEVREGKFTQNECFDISIKDGDFTLKLGQKQILTGNILKGNAWGL